MDKSKKTPSKKSKGTDEAVPAFGIDLQKICTENGLNITIVCYVLNSEVTSGLPWSTYSVPTKPDSDEQIVNVYIAYDNFERQGTVNKLYIKYENKINVNFLEALFLLFPKYDTFTSLQLDYCKLSANEIEYLQTILSEFQNIIDVSLDGNPNIYQNFAVLLNETNIKYLSLKRCKINERGIKTICKNLWHSPSNKLLTLNLTGNYIADNAVKHLVEMLRQNRKLRTINLADNWITDAGCCEIMSSLQSFILTHDEIVIKRKINFDYYKQKAELVEEYKKENESKLQFTLENQKSKKSLKKDKSLSKENVSDTHEDKQLTFFIEGNITKRTHPFTLDILEKDGKVHCSGNMKLSYINLAHNKISCTGYRCIIDTLNYQLINDFLGTGITYITLDGNTDLNTPEFKEIYKLLMEKKLKQASQNTSKTTILNRRSSSKYTSVINVT